MCEPGVTARARCAVGALLTAFVLERNADLGSVASDVAVVDGEVKLRDLTHPQVPERSARLRHGRGRRLLPGITACTHEFDDLVNALGHGSSFRAAVPFDTF